MGQPLTSGLIWVAFKKSFSDSPFWSICRRMLAALNTISKLSGSRAMISRYRAADSWSRPVSPRWRAETKGQSWYRKVYSEVSEEKLSDWQEILLYTWWLALGGAKIIKIACILFLPWVTDDSMTGCDGNITWGNNKMWNNDLNLFGLLWNQLISMAQNFLVWRWWTCSWTLEFVDFKLYAI